MDQGVRPTTFLPTVPGNFSIGSHGTFIKNGVVPSSGSFECAVLQRNYEFVQYMLYNDILTQEWGIHLALEANDAIMLKMLLYYGVEPDDDDVDRCILEHDLDTATMLTDEYDCLPTKEAFHMLFEKVDKGMDAYDYIRFLDWLYNKQGVDMDLDVLQTVRNIEGIDAVVVNWVVERVE